MEQGEKLIRLVTALVECRPDGEYVPWGIKWYDGTVYTFDRIESYSSRSWALGRNRQSESWRVVVNERQFHCCLTSVKEGRGTETQIGSHSVWKNV